MRTTYTLTWTYDVTVDGPYDENAAREARLEAEAWLAGVPEPTVTPTSCATAEVRTNSYPYAILYNGRVEAHFTERSEAEAWLLTTHKATLYTLAELDEPLVLTELTCPVCGSTEFCWQESYGECRDFDGQTGDESGGQVAVFWNGSDGQDDGDGEPGLVCGRTWGEGCGVLIDLPAGWEIDYR